MSTKPNAAVAPSGLKYVKGREIDLEKAFQEGSQVYVLEFWATWCPPCRDSIPYLTQLQKKLEGKVTIIGITQEPLFKVAPFLAQMGSKMDYTVCLDEDGYAEDHYMTKYKVKGIPCAFIVGKDGNVAWHGHPLEPEFTTQLEKAISSANPNKKYTEEELKAMSVKEIKNILTTRGVNFMGVLEKSELVELAAKL
jgi:thiol-disulfide isomerase/thioredoxin